MASVVIMTFFIDYLLDWSHGLLPSWSLVSLWHSNLGKVRQIKPAQLAFRRTINIILLTYLSSEWLIHFNDARFTISLSVCVTLSDDYLMAVRPTSNSIAFRSSIITRDYREWLFTLLPPISMQSIPVPCHFHSQLRHYHSHTFPLVHRVN